MSDQKYIDMYESSDMYESRRN